MASTKETLEALLRGELAAVETYDKAIRQTDASADKVRLQRLKREHQAAVGALRHLLARHHALAVHGAGAWGRLALVTEKVANVFGSRARLRALMSGEEHGIKLYQRALLDQHVAPEAKALIHATLLPSCVAHLDALGRMIE